jgi:hypothetical protein
LKDASGFKIYSIWLIALLLACSIFLTSCFGDDNSNSTISSTQDSPITPIGVPATCLTVHSPTLLKLSDGHYQLIDEINNCAGKEAGPLKVAAQITAGTTMHSVSLFGTSVISPNGKALYRTYSGKPDSKDKEIDFLSPASSPADVIVLVTLNGTQQGEWDGQVTIPF